MEMVLLDFQILNLIVNFIAETFNWLMRAESAPGRRDIKVSGTE